MNQESKHDIKEKIRQRYRGGDVENIRLVGEDGEVKTLKGFPAEWAGQFGLSAYNQFNSVRLPEEDLQGLDALWVEEAGMNNYGNGTQIEELNGTLTINIH